MKTGLVGYLTIPIAAVIMYYMIEIYWSSTLALETNHLLPWLIAFSMHAVLGGLGWALLRSQRLILRIALLTLIPVLPPVLFAITHGVDSAYPYIGLILIIPNLLWVAIGAGVAAVLIRRTARVV